MRKWEEHPLNPENSKVPISPAMKRIVFSVTNDLSFDQRMNRICSTLAAEGYDCTLVGRKRPHSLPLGTRIYRQVRLRCFFDSGKLFYLEYNFRLFWFLLFTRADIYCSVDLDTILPSLYCSVLKRKKLVYDAHEFFTEMEEIISRPWIHKAWSWLERYVMKHIKHAYTISEGYAALYKKKYNIHFEVIRNIPPIQPITPEAQEERFIIYQGALNIGRGIEEAIEAMPMLGELHLKIFGEGPNAENLRELANKTGADNRVQFMGALKPEALRNYTNKAWLGLTLFSETGLHHRYSLANRFFDYLHAGIPQVAMKYPEYEAFNAEHEVAILIGNLEPETIALAVRKLYFDPTHYERLKQNCSIARERYCWEKESVKLLAFYQRL